MEKKRTFMLLALAFMVILSNFASVSFIKAEDLTDFPGNEKIIFDDIDVSTLEAKGFTSTKFTRTASGQPFNLVDGEADQPVSKHWFSGEGNDTPYNGVSGISSKNIGIKPNTNSDNDRYYLNTPYTYKNFQMSVEIYWGVASGVAIGKKNVYPNSESDPSVNIYFNNNRIQLNGALDFSTATVKGNNGAFSVYAGTTGLFDFEKNHKATNGQVYSLNVKMENGLLTVWVDGYGGVLTVRVSENYEGETISLLGRKFGGDSGGFKSFLVRNLEVEGYVDFDNIDVTTLDAKGFTSTKFTRTASGQPFNLVEGEADQPASKHWFSGDGNDTPYNGVSGVQSKNIGIKPRTNSDNDRYYLNTPYTYKNFEMSVEIYWGVASGVAIGKKNVYPNSESDPSVNIYFNNNRLQLYGALDFSTATVTGNNGAFSVYAGTTGLFDFEKNHKATNGKAYTLNVKMENGLLTVWVNGYDGILRVRVSDNFEGEAISLLGRKFGGDSGGFKSCLVRKLDDYEKIIFDNIDVSILDAKGFTSTKFTRTASGQPFNLVKGEADQPASKHWFSGDGNDTPYNGVSGVVSKNIGIKPKTNSDNDRYYLNTPYTYKNFEMSVEIYWGVASGVAIGKKNVYPNSESDPSVNIYFNNNRIQLNGVLDFSTATVTGNNANFTLYGGTTGLFDFEKNHKATNGKAYTLNVKMENGLLTIWIDGYDGVLTVRVSENYEGETISLLGRKFGGDSGGFKSCLVRELEDRERIIFDNIDVSELDEKGFTSTKFTRTASGQPFELVEGETDQPASKHWFSGDGNDTPYNGVSGVVSKNIGIKPKTNSDNDRYYLNTPYTYKNFEMSVEIYWGVASGVAIGKKNVYPNSESDPSVNIYFNNNRLQLYGALDFSTATVTGNNANFTLYGGTTGLFDFEKNHKATNGQVYSLNVKMKNGLLTIWIDGYDGVLTVRVSENYEGETISLLGRKFGGDSGGFKSCLVRELEDYEKVYFDNIDVTTLDTKGFTSTKFSRAESGQPFDLAEGEADQPVSKHWFSGDGNDTPYNGVSGVLSKNIGIKPKTNSDNDRYYLNTPYTYKDFEMSVEIYWGVVSGVAIGKRNVYPNSESDPSVIIYFNNNRIQLNGALDFSTATVTGNNTNFTLYGGTTGLFDFEKNHKATNGQTYTLNVKMKNGLLTVWVNAYDGVLRIRVADYYEGETISLLGRKFGGDSGGFKSCLVRDASSLPDEPIPPDDNDDGPDREYNPETTVYFNFKDPSVLNEFTHYYAEKPWETGLKQTDFVNGEYWQVGRGILKRTTKSLGGEGYSAENTTKHLSELILEKYKFTNFELEVDYEQGSFWGWPMIGFGISKPGEPVKVKDSAGNREIPNPGGGVMAFVEREGNVNMMGNILGGTHENFTRLRTPALNGYMDIQKMHRMRIRVVNGIVELFIDDNNEPLIARLGESAVSGYIAIVANTYGIVYDNLMITALDENGEPMPLSMLVETEPEDQEDITLPLDDWGEIPLEDLRDDNQDINDGDPDPVPTGISLPEASFVMAILSGSLTVFIMCSRRRKRN